MSSIRLCMIARDEAARLPAIAEEINGIIDSVCILVDDRTTDDTIRVAEELWADLPGGGLVTTFRFDDFAQARNDLMRQARDGLPEDAYLLLLDPDSVPDGVIPEDLTAPIYYCEWRMNSITWTRAILVRADVTDARYVGAVHEVMVHDSPSEMLHGCHVNAVVTADRSRLEGFIPLLERDAAINPRSAFYLAQTYRDLGRLEDAFGWYMRRAGMGDGWIEETYMALYEAALLLQRFDFELAATLWQRCLKLRTRAEPCYQLARQANMLGNPSEALAWASLGLRMGASADQLFVNRWIETEGLSEEFNKAAVAMMPASQPTVEVAHV